MNTVRSYTWPFLLALVSGLTAFADIAKDTFIAEMLAYALVGLGVAALVAFKAPGISSFMRRSFPRMGNDFSPAAFTMSCGVLGVAVFGFAQISSRLADQGGVIAAAFPEVEQLQAQLGVVETKIDDIAEVTMLVAEQTSEIAEDAEFLKEAAGKWIGVTNVHLYAASEGGHIIDTQFRNSTSFVSIMLKWLRGMPKLAR